MFTAQFPEMPKAGSRFFSSAETAEERVFDGPAAAKKDAKENTG